MREWAGRHTGPPVSFEVMRRARNTTAFAFDQHVEIAGYSLLR